MLALRLARGARPFALLRRLPLLAASAGVSALLLATLAHAHTHRGHTAESAARLLWCLVPLAVTAGLAGALARTDTSGTTRGALDAAGLGAARLPLLAAASAALTAALGSVLVLLTVTLPREDPRGPVLPGTAVRLPAPSEPLPLPAGVTLLCVVPLAAALAAAWATRPGREPRTVTARFEGGAESESGPAHVPGPRASLLGGCLLASCGAALGVTVSPPGGWALAALGLVAAGPGLVHVTGRLLAAGRPGAVRLLAGRGLQREAPRVGRPLGVLCAVASAGLAAAWAHGSAAGRTALPGLPGLPGPPGALTALGAAVVLCCVAVGALTSLAGVRASRAHGTAVLAGLGAPRALLRRVALARAGTLLCALALLVWVMARLAPLPVG
ncbi:hypothetical protein GCM10009801_79370 [Streptomyces albiaxialis]|uniref:Integral membrane protein n=1 Tax=Streptomyces albiaxialis TaxID=329523 RepID=A0ABN2X3K8_9ACTN